MNEWGDYEGIIKMEQQDYTHQGKEKAMKYELEVPIIGYYWCKVEATSEKEAEEKAFELFADLENIDVMDREDYQLMELNPTSIIVEGNVFHGSTNTISITKDEQD